MNFNSILAKDFFLIYIPSQAGNDSAKEKLQVQKYLLGEAYPLGFSLKISFASEKKNSLILHIQSLHITTVVKNVNL